MHKVSFISALVFTIFLSQVSLVQAGGKAIIIGKVGISVLNWHIYVMQHKRFLEREGIQAKFVKFISNDRALSSLAEGSIQIIGAAATEKVIQSQMRGGQVITTGGVITKAPYSLVTVPKADSVEVLRGKYIGIPQFDSGLSLMLRESLKREGLFYPKDYRLIEISGPERYMALKYGKVSGALVINPVDTRSGFVPVKDMAKSFPNYQFTITAMNRSWADHNYWEAVLVMKATARAINWLLDRKNREEAIYVLKNNMKTDDTFADGAYNSLITEYPVFSKNAEINSSAMNTLIYFMVKAGTLKRGEYNPSVFNIDQYRLKAIQDINGKN